jgi:hypothetical protein
MLRVAALLMLLGTGIQAAAAPAQPIVRVDVSPESVGVGESAELRVTVLVPTWFTRPPVYPSFELANAITRLPPDSSYPTSERVGRETWSGIVRNYRFYPLLGATYRLPGETITVTYANPGVAALTAEVPVPEIVIRGVVPEGAEALDPYLAGTRLTMKQTLDGGVEPLGVGDAVVVRNVAELDGLPAIFLPPLFSRLSIDGVSIYPESPQVDDGPPGRREEQLTLVFDTPGTFTLPGRELSWWNTRTGRIETTAVKPVTFSVSGPVTAAAEPESSLQGSAASTAAIIAALLTLSIVSWKAAPVMVRKARSAAQARRQSEPYAFGQLRRSVRASDPSATYASLLAWLDRLDADLDARGFASTYGDEQLEAALASLNAHLYGKSSGSPYSGELWRPLVAARERFIRHGGQASTAARLIPPLNP